MLLTSAYGEGTLEFLKTLNSAQSGTWPPSLLGVREPERLDQLIPLKNLMMSVKSMLLSRIISL